MKKMAAMSRSLKRYLPGTREGPRRTCQSGPARLLLSHARYGARVVAEGADEDERRLLDGGEAQERAQAARRSVEFVGKNHGQSLLLGGRGWRGRGDVHRHQLHLHHGSAWLLHAFRGTRVERTQLSTATPCPAVTRTRRRQEPAKAPPHTEKEEAFLCPSAAGQGVWGVSGAPWLPPRRQAGETPLGGPGTVT